MYPPRANRNNFPRHKFTNEQPRTKKNFSPNFCVFVYPSTSWKNHRKTLGQRNTDFLGYDTLDALVHENSIGLRPDLSSNCQKKNTVEELILAPIIFHLVKTPPPPFFRYQHPESHWPRCLPLDSFNRACSPPWPKYHSNPEYKVVEHNHDSSSLYYQHKPE